LLEEKLKTGNRNTTNITRKLCYRTDDRAMRAIQGGPN